RVGDDAFQPMDGAGGILDAQALARVAESARLLVVHGVTGDVPDWVVRAQAAGERVIVFTHDVEGARRVGLVTDPARAGEWYAVEASGPVAAALAGVEWASLPPLLAPHPLDEGGAGALVVERGGGVRAGVLEMAEEGGR